MAVVSLICAHCGAPIQQPPDDIDQITCMHCGTMLSVQRGEGYAATKIVEQVEQAIEESSAKTLAELRRLQLQQELTSNQLQFSTLESEIRLLQRSQQTDQVRYQLNQLYTHRTNLVTRINSLQNALFPPVTTNQPAPASVPTPAPAPTPLSHKRAAAYVSGCLIGLFTCCILDFGFTLFSRPIDQVVFGVAKDTPGPVSLMGLIVAIVLGLVAFIAFIILVETKIFRRT